MPCMCMPCVCMPCVCVHIDIYVCEYIHTRGKTICVHLSIHACIHAYTRTHRLIGSCMYAYIHAYIHIYIHTYTYIHTHMHTNIHIYKQALQAERDTQAKKDNAKKEVERKKSTLPAEPPQVLFSVICMYVLCMYVCAKTLNERKARCPPSHKRYVYIYMHVGVWGCVCMLVQRTYMYI
jgi:hypothetical protein